MPLTDTAATRALRPSRPAPSTHVRALLTWVAIFPLVTIGSMLLAPITGSWHPVLRTALLTALVVPAAFYVAVPQLVRLYGVIAHRLTRDRD
ncbi:hypothetical protein ACH3VR_11155 [Microbacterium sp. B2969]|uniref:Uncharacterized protein n=1 Tax=Microbacterium alkaliflavum TaxID=3248839 RepID=A0ABW7Q7T4_9MICO